MNATFKKTGNALSPYLSSLGVWALAFGCSVGWGAFVMPGTTFLPVAGPLGTALGIALGALVMLVLGLNYHYLMNLYPDCGGTYAYTKKCFGYDHGFLSAWFLAITYLAIIWANATALPLIARTLFGDLFQFGFTYEIAGFRIYLGEIILAVTALLAATLICLRRSLSQCVQVVAAALLLGGVVVCFVCALSRRAGDAAALAPAFSPDQTALGGTLTIFALAPWAFVGFESICHSAAEFRFPMKRAFRVIAVSIVSAAFAYIALAVMAAAAQPEGCAGWTDYLANLGRYAGLASQPTFYAASLAMNGAGTILLGLAALCAILTGLVGNTVALSRLLCALAEDGMLPGRIGEVDENHVPKHAIWAIFAVSVILPFFGRTAISWIVDVTTVGATIAYAFTSATALKTARQEENRRMKAVGVAGLAISMLFALGFLIPNVFSVTTLSTESYLILASWGILGFICFHYLLRHDANRRLGRSIVAWVVLLGLIIFTSSVWMRQTAESSLENSTASFQSYYGERLADEGSDAAADETETIARLRQSQGRVSRSLRAASHIQTALIVLALVILFDIYGKMQKRERKIEIEKVLAEENSRAKTSFLSNMSHEIRTPMNAIIGIDNIALKDPNLAPHTREQFEKIGMSARHLLGIINDILDMSRIESGRMVLKNEEFSFRDFIDPINVMISGQCAEKGLEYDCQTIGRLKGYYIGDEMKLKQVLINILGNAVKFTPAPGNVSLSVEQIAEFEGHCTLRFIISDTGVGMKKEFIPKIFEAFSQEDASVSTKYGSTGLGMAITKNIVEMMNGEIGVESEQGVGSTFTVTVTLKASDRVDPSMKESALPTEPPAAEGEAALSLKGRRVLIAEDMDINADILMDLLEMEGVESERAENGQIAVEMFESKPPRYYDAVLMDMRMPVMDGLEATKAIRALEREDARRVPIIAMTANAFDDDVQRSLQAGMNAHLSKPVEPDHLYRTLDELIREAVS